MLVAISTPSSGEQRDHQRWHSRAADRALCESVRTFDAGAMLIDLNSAEAELLDGSILITASTAEFLSDLYEAFVSLN